MIIEKTENYIVIQSYASRTENEFEVYDLNENLLGYFVERFEEFEVYHSKDDDDFTQIDYCTDFADAVNMIVSV